MKKTLFKVAFVVVFSLSGACKARAGSSLSRVDALHFSESMNIPHKGAERFSYFLAMGTQENLKAYHLGLKALFMEYHIPSAQDLFESIRSHSNFLGLLTKDEAVNEFNKANNGFVLFEEKNRSGVHFYIIHAKGLRHFSVNETGFASIDNAQGIRYPFLTSLLKSTAVF